MHNAPVERAQRLQLDDIAPTPDFFRGVLGLFDKRFAGLGAVAAHVHHHLGHVRVLLEKDAVGDVLQVGKRLALAANEAARIFRFHVEQEAVLEFVFFDGGAEAEQLQDFFQRGFRLSRHSLTGC